MLLSALATVLVISLQDTPPLPPQFRCEAVVLHAVLTPDGENLIALDQEGTLYGWQRQTRKRLYIRRGLAKPEVPRRLACSPDGGFLALSERELPAGEVLIIRVATGEVAMRLERGSSPAFSPDGTYVACSDGRQVRRWSLKSGAELPSLEQSPTDLRCVAWSPTGDRIVAGDASSDAIFSWDLPGREIRLLAGMTYNGPVSSLAFEPQGKLLAVGTHWGIRYRPADQPQSHVGRDFGEYSRGDLSFSADGTQLIAVDRRRQVTLWNVRTGEVEFRWSVAAGNSEYPEVSTGGKRLIWLRGSGIRLERIPRPLEGGRTGNVITAVGFRADGKAITGGRNAPVQVWDPATETEVRRYTVPNRRVVQFANEGRWAVFGGGREEVLIWDLDAGKGILNVADPPFVNRIAVSPDGSTLGLALLDGSIALWDIAGRKERTRIALDGGSVDAIVWSSDGKTLACGSRGGQVVMADGSSGGDRVVYATRGPAIHGLMFARDGKRVLATYGDGSQRFYTGEIGREPEKPDWESLVWMNYPDPRWMRTGMRSQQAELKVFSPDGRTALTTNGSSAMIWQAPWDP